MKARNCTIKDLEKALVMVNKKYHKNVCFKNIEQSGRMVTFTLRVNNSRDKGARISHSGRHIPAACWHVHGDFFESLFKIKPEAVIVSQGNKKITKDSGNWQDWNIGSIIYPMFYSEACEC